MPIFDYIPFINYIPDLLHLFLRVTGKMSNIFFRKFQQHDGYSSTKFQDAYKEFLTNTRRISDPVIVDQKNNNKLKDLMGEEFKRLASNISLLRTIYKDLNGINIMINVWEGFFQIYENIKINQLSYVKIEELCLNWLGQFLSIFSHEDLTPYMHVFVFHLHEFFELYGNINIFNLQVLEKKNDIVTTQFYHSTNRHKKPAKTKKLVNQLVTTI